MTSRKTGTEERRIIRPKCRQHRRDSIEEEAAEDRRDCIEKETAEEPDGMITRRCNWSYILRTLWTCASSFSLAIVVSLTRRSRAPLMNVNWLHMSLAHCRRQRSMSARTFSEISRSLRDLSMFSCVNFTQLTVSETLNTGQTNSSCVQST